jgi:hypothetical protein
MQTLVELLERFPDHPDLSKRLYFFLEAMMEEDYDGILLLTYPAIFDVVPKSVMREKLMATFEGDETTIAIDSFEIDDIGSVLQFDAGQYVQVFYTALMSLHLHEDEEGDEERKQERKTFLLRMFKAFYGEENIWFEVTTGRYCFYQQKSVIGILNDRSPQWTFLSYQPGSELDRFIPSIVLEQMQPPPTE